MASQSAKPEELAIPPNVYYTVEEAAKLLRVSVDTVRQLLRSRRARGIRIGRQWRILGAALIRMTPSPDETDAETVADWLAASTPSLREIWNNEEVAAYDNL